MSSMDLLAAFRLLDTNGDGQVTADELKPLFVEAGVPWDEGKVQAAMANIDHEGDGFSLEEFRAAYDWCMDDAAMHKPYREYFDLFDVDKDGKITESELRLVFRQYGVQVADSEVHDLMLENDSNRDGYLTFPEFEKMVCRYRYVVVSRG